MSVGNQEWEGFEAGVWRMLNSRLSLRLQEFRPAAPSPTEKGEAVFEVTDVCTSWSLDFAADLFLDPSRAGESQCPRNFRGTTGLAPLDQNTILNSPAVQPCVGVLNSPSLLLQLASQPPAQPSPSRAPLPIRSCACSAGLDLTRVR